MKLNKLHNALITVLLIITIIFWAIILGGVWTHPIAEGAPAFAPNEQFLSAAGILLAAVGTSTAASLGFSVADTRRTLLNNSDPSWGEVLEAIGYPVIIGTVAYLLIGLAVALTAWATPTGQTVEALGVYGMSFVGWVAGAFGALLKRPEN